MLLCFISGYVKRHLNDTAAAVEPMLRELIKAWNSSTNYNQRITILSMFVMNFTYSQLAALNSTTVQGRRSRRFDPGIDTLNPIDNAISKIPDKNCFNPPITKHIYMRSRMMYHEFQVYMLICQLSKK